MAVKRKKKQKPNIAALCWLVMLLLLVVIFVIKQNDIREVLRETDFFTKVFGISSGLVESTITAPAAGAGPPPAPVVPPPAVPSPPAIVPPVQTAVGAAEEQSVQTAAIPDTRLWFIQVDEDGSLSRREVRRPATKSDSPLTAAIQSLLGGPTSQEQERGCVNLIPPGARLLSVSIANRVASLNFSEEFEYNRYGVEGYFGQLEQIIYTATAFSTVDSVQFLIDGQRRDYIGGEGVWIGSPLSRTSLRR
jgi:hypothetical protein